MADSNFTVMVVEDEDLLLEAIGKKLQQVQMFPILCRSGKEAVDYLSAHEQVPNAVWLDYYLKDTDGLALMTLLKQNPKWENIPVVVVSNSASTLKVNNMLALGAKKYLLKAEYRLEDIVDIIRQLNETK
ncbi:hypothetical protein A2866_01780 [Candidatus Roizmanbacteria bacterium RIFCSPHIGHO2_01_FULL_39_8]|uniref:Response regulatory domain-containing protein n=2 Tax=Candidatus Roizmaniibacteriota TaxID=1752723 RepID=A0A1F7GKI2_9BACT|nr:MAG: hypothetical protein A2866_01780 [Candidatus Roizmanbacteria bacterium RIFCSPHIGHO2_01_FULL_39_8]OGK25700.1 MAG: hypothetical protein A3C28_01550 [Candidatus Roizmanbacteria bacterium RIFCSPHIGHO2_02_FULL_39_9]